MKANIQGIEVEGTPEEIAELKLILEKQLNDTIDKFKEYKPAYIFPQYPPPMYIGDPMMWPCNIPYKWSEVICKMETNTSFQK